MALTDEQKLAFKLQHTLKMWAKITIKELRKSIVNKGAYDTGALYKSFRYNLTYGENGIPTKVSIGFDMHGRFIDMGVGNGVKIENVKTNREIWRNLSRKEKKGKKNREPIKWYSKKMYHQYQVAAEILTSKYAIEIPARFEKLFKEKK